ncbi:hypothetical protein [Anaerobaca lacustris]|uniref:PpiC domain-containing protein n=1 Tax=Anaerobaca lacustris TaxID=3044600 RepID=A0AAW6TV63_9BACT|nr:hypothetical protein [Sedimentisphaerales bacterium M17dextr]
MNLVKWFRKNNKKVMAVVVIVLMVGFIGGSAIEYLFQGSGGANEAVAFYGKQKISHYDREMARQELEILQMLGAAQVLQSRDLLGILLSEVLFSQERASAEVLEYARQMIQRNRYRVGDKELQAIYSKTVPTDIYWILLCEEARSAGIHISSEDVGRLLAQVIPQLFGGQTYGTVMQNMVSRYGMSEDHILTTYGKVLAVLQYAEIICSVQAVTGSQIRHLASFENESMNAEVVQMRAAYFADKSITPSQAELVEQFTKYKDVFPGDASEANPYGFGYKLPDRLQLEYIAVRLADVSSIVPVPTQEDMETFYRDNRNRLFTEQVATDPNDPNSPLVERLRDFSEVVGDIREQLTQQRITTRAEQILVDARNEADARLAPLRAREEKPSVEEMQREAGDYQKIAQDLSVKHGVALYSGRTGLLSAMDLQNDRHLGRLLLTGYGQAPIRLSQLLFSVEQFGERAVTLMSVPDVQMFRSIGPLRDLSAAIGPNLSDQIMVMVRIVAIEPVAPPESLDVTYSTRTLRVGGAATDDSVHSVREKVVEDLRKLAAWDATKARAQEFVALAAQDGWDDAVTKYNELYGEQAKEDPNDPDVFELQHLTGLRRISAAQLQVIATQAAANPAAPEYLRRLGAERRFMDRLHSLIPPDRDEATEVPLVMEFKPDQSFYCLRSLSIRRLNQEQFESIRPMLLSREEHGESQSLATTHLNPENILKRMDFRFAEQITPVADRALPEDPV